MERMTQVDGTHSTSASSGALGPELAEAIADYQRSLDVAVRAEAAHEQAQREVSEARARLTALTLGAKVTGSRALVVVQPPADDHDEE